MSAALQSQAIVIFGASGDLTRRKLLPAFYNLFLEGRMPEGFAIVGYARSAFTDDEFRQLAHDAVKEFGKHPPEGHVWSTFAERLAYVPGEFDQPGAMDHISEALAHIDRRFGTQGNRFFYAATPPDAYPDIVLRIGEAGEADGSKIVLEKPFGYDLESARELNAVVSEVFDESQVFRIDHYLGKETVQNILAFRFGNGLFEPVWNRRYLDHVQITVAESIGVGSRASFYEQTGAVRDMISTHLFQMLTFLAMEPPVSFEPDRLRDETVKVLRSAKTCDPGCLVRGQYRGYRAEPDVNDRSQVETYAALRVDIDNWRWADVPFFLRTGKRLASKVTEITLKFRKVPFNLFDEIDGELPRRDHLTFRIQPDEGITLAVNAKKPGPGMQLGRVRMDFDYEHEFGGVVADAYELLLLEVMEGDHTLFLRQDEVERSWEILDPVLSHEGPVMAYEPGSWGPVEAEALIAPRKWHISTEPHED
ncbi:MAG: glucose-6-phosphate dehydrogenase [Actinomycetota bacterium]